ncbi:hypothetical protein LTR78_007019 [Recurvomyces mirabilis]|uniref:Uncharacterized protein n=1 Tax=Recurvomyces mirabilis TaxID=574656 RepID=A0AAE0WK44_9PEZI|nr:hypothetical protein LTR78_007019 [Recurvomyces mirabilis]KAK5153403.1 hypothetical protein LTS14_007572 [Recurvomyces mirabilis]
MARKSERLSESTKSTPAHKRAASATAIPSAEVKRPKTAKSTPMESQYFADDNPNKKITGDIGDQDDDDESSVEEPVSASDFDEDENRPESSDPEEDDDYDSEKEQSSKRKSVSRKGAKSSPVIRTKVSAVSKAGEKTGLAPGTQLIIKKPKARPAGKTHYVDEKLHPNTFLFLQDLKANNNRSWLKMNDLEFRQAEKDWHSFVEALTSRLSEIDDTVPELPVKDVVCNN